LEQPGLAHVVDTQRQQDSMLRQLIDVQSQLIQNQQDYFPLHYSERLDGVSIADLFYAIPYRS
jgi:hypothetical protein